jgi:hypothetical protein
MPGLASSQSNPSRPPEPVQWVPQDTSFSPVFFTHLPLRHWLSLEQKQPPGAIHSLDVPLQAPNGHENPVAVEDGQPPAGQGTPPSNPASDDVPSQALAQPPFDSMTSAGASESSSFSGPSVPDRTPESMVPSAEPSPDIPWTLPSHPAPGHSPLEYAVSPEMAAHAPSRAANPAAPTTPSCNRIVL